MKITNPGPLQIIRVDPIQLPEPITKHRVTIFSVRVNNDHDPFFDGEWKMYADLNGEQKFVDTCTPTPPRQECDGAMNDVGSGETVRFNPPLTIDVEKPKSGPLIT